MPGDQPELGISQSAFSREVGDRMVAEGFRGLPRLR
jgi:hypothetical protein